MTVQSAQVRRINYVHKRDTRHQYFKLTDAWVILATLQPWTRVHIVAYRAGSCLTDTRKNL